MIVKFNYFKYKFPFSKSNDNVLDNVLDINENKILLLLEQNPSLSANQIGKQIGLGDRQIRRLIQKLRNDGRIIRIGSDRKGYWKINK